MCTVKVISSDLHLYLYLSIIVMELNFIQPLGITDCSNRPALKAVAKFPPRLEAAPKVQILPKIFELQFQQISCQSTGHRLFVIEARFIEQVVSRHFQIFLL
jgi:hypothetical protein